MALSGAVYGRRLRLIDLLELHQSTTPLNRAFARGPVSLFSKGRSALFFKSRCSSRVGFKRLTDLQLMDVGRNFFLGIRSHRNGPVGISGRCDNPPRSSSQCMHATGNPTRTSSLPTTIGLSTLPTPWQAWAAMLSACRQRADDSYPPLSMTGSILECARGRA